MFISCRQETCWSVARRADMGSVAVQIGGEDMKIHVEGEAASVTLCSEECGDIEIVCYGVGKYSILTTRPEQKIRLKRKADEEIAIIVTKEAKT